MNTEYKLEARKQKSGLISVIIIISYLGSTGIALEKCIQSADMCLYVSKNTGRNRVTVQ